MKFLTLLFSIYMLILPCLPCTDTAECNESSLTAIARAENHQEHQHDREACSPFCSCACCGQTVSPTIQTVEIVIAKAFIVKSPKSSYENISIPSDHSGNIWQPPKFC